MYKQVILVRTDLKLGKGKIASQVAHASLGAYKLSKVKKKWEDEGTKKVVLRVKNLKELLEVCKKVRKLKLPFFLVRDAGRTQVSEGTITCLAIGPCKEEIVDRLTKKFKLL